MQGDNRRLAGMQDVAHFTPPETLTEPQAIDPKKIPWLFLKKPGGEIDVFEPGDSLFKLCVTGETIQAGLWRALPGEMFWMDRHEGSDELWYIIEGEATFWLPDTRQTMVAERGEFFFVPAGARHQTINRGDEALLVLFASAPVLSPTHH